MPSLFHGKTTVEGKNSIKQDHDVGNGCAVSDTRLDSSSVKSQTDFSLPSVASYTPEEQSLMTRAAIATRQTRDVLRSSPSPYDGQRGFLNPSTGLQPRTATQQYPTQRSPTLRRRNTRPFQRSLQPEDVMSQGVELNAAWKKQVRENSLALNALCEARKQGREANAIPNNGADNGADLSDFNARYQEYLERRGLANINESTRHIERLSDQL